MTEFSMYIPAVYILIHSFADKGSRKVCELVKKLDTI